MEDDLDQSASQSWTNPLELELKDGERLQKVLARLGYGSRRVTEDMIVAGRVKVNGKVAILGTRFDAESDQLEVDAKAVNPQPGLVYYLLNKPAAVISSASDPVGRTSVLEFVPAEPRVFSVGRLDYMTEGLLILTNDGDLAQQLTHPSFGVDKEYLAHVNGSPSRGALAVLRSGVMLDDGMTAPAKVSLISSSVLRITIHEGRNRQIRRMLDAVGHSVIRLVRVRIGTLTDSRLEPGQYRELTSDEVIALRSAAGPVRKKTRGGKRVLE